MKFYFAFLNSISIRLYYLFLFCIFFTCANHSTGGETVSLDLNSYIKNIEKFLTPNNGRFWRFEIRDSSVIIWTPFDDSSGTVPDCNIYVYSSKRGAGVWRLTLQAILPTHDFTVNDLQTSEVIEVRAKIGINVATIAQSKALEGTQKNDAPKGALLFSLGYEAIQGIINPEFKSQPSHSKGVSGAKP